MVEPRQPSQGARTIRVRCVELSPVVGDLVANLALVEAAIRDSAGAESELLVLPELATSGYMLSIEEAHACALSVDDDAFTRWAGLLRKDQTVVVGFCEDGGDGRLYNSAAVLTASGVATTYRKTHLWDAEKELFHPGDEAPRVVDTPVGALGVLVCYDLEFPEMPRRLALAGADLIAVPTNWPLVPRPQGEHPPEVIQAMAAARASSVAIICCDRRGDERGVRWTEGTAVIGTDGWPLGTKSADGLLEVDIVLHEERRTISDRNQVFEDRRPSLYVS